MSNENYDLKALKAAADAACEAAIAHKAEIGGSVNWGDIGSVNVERCEDWEGDIRYVVTCEEAAPDAWQFQEFVYEQLKDAGFTNVEIVTEW